MDWKECFDTLYGRQLHDVWGVSNTEIETIIHHISTEIIEKLIDELNEVRDKVLRCHSPQGSDAPLTDIKAARLIERIDALDVLDEAKQQLRDKWL